VIAPARVAAYRVLYAVAAGRADLPSALARERDALADERDRALAGEIAVGSLRWQAAADHLVTAFAGRAVEKLDLEVLTVLRLGIFQLLHLDRVPAAAVVDDAVELARKAGKRSAAGFVNALLRRVSRERTRLPLPGEPRDRADREGALAYLSIALSHPRWLVERWLDRVGYDAAAAWARFDNAPAPLTLRVNTLRTTRNAAAGALRAVGVETTPSEFAANGLVVSSGNPLLTPLAHSGQFVIQDEASQLVGEFVGARTGDAIFDACASPGGKTTQMAAAMRDSGLIVAADVRGRRVALLSRTVAESGATCIRLVQADARASLPLLDRTFDVVLIDAPCSGLGTIRRDPDVRWRRQAADLPSLASAQLEMLDRASRLITPGGRIIYATCSSEPEENDDVVAAFVAEHRGFAIAAPPAGLVPPQVLDARGCLRTMPHQHGLEAFFAARLVHKDASRRSTVPAAG
jgi:16S rRNA (cytosine967-C5)-methyltransferase